MKAHYTWIIPLAVGAGILLIPTPQGLPFATWAFFAVFLTMVAALVLEPIPSPLCGLLAVIASMVFRLVPSAPGKAASASDAIKWGLSGFSDATVWLIFAAFMFAMGYEKTGLGKRLALLLIRRLGSRTLGLGYAVALADLVLAPFMPSMTARSGGTIFPIVKNIPPLYGSTPENNPRGMGAYLMWTAMASTCITSSMFLTSLAPNVLSQSIVEKTVHMSINWNQWFLSYLPVGIILFAAVPLLGYVLYPPTCKVSRDAPIWAGEELRKLGPVSRREITMGALAVFALVNWIFFKDAINATTVALAAVALMVLLKVVTWKDVTTNNAAWGVLVWFSTLVSMSDGLSKTGFLKWFAEIVLGHMQGASPMFMLVSLVSVYYLIHYFFSTQTAHVTALLPMMLAIGMNVEGMNMPLFVMLLCTSLGMLGIFTPYSCGPSPIYFGSGYIKGAEYWRLGAVFGLVFLVVFLVVGIPWNLAIN
jgi:L-tartrate/succinate antiporter